MTILNTLLARLRSRQVDMPTTLADPPRVLTSIRGRTVRVMSRRPEMERARHRTGIVMLIDDAQDAYVYHVALPGQHEWLQLMAAEMEIVR